MDPDTTQKVSDLLSLMEDISSDIDVQAELKNLGEEVAAIKQSLQELADRFDTFEQTYRQKKTLIRDVQAQLRELQGD